MHFIFNNIGKLKSNNIPLMFNNHINTLFMQSNDIYVYENYLKIKLVHLSFYTENKDDMISFISMMNSKRTLEAGISFLDNEQYKLIRKRVN